MFQSRRTNGAEQTGNNFDSNNTNPVVSNRDVVSLPLNDYSHIDDVLEIIGFGKSQVYILLTLGFFLMGFVCETMGIAVISILVRCNFQITERQVVNLRIAALLGVVSSSLLWGYLCDKYGRRKVLYYCMIVSTLFSISSMMCIHYTLFFIFRCLTGFFVAGASSISLTYMSDFVSPKQRAYATNYLCLFIGLGMLYIPGSASLLAQEQWFYKVNDNFQIVPWRVLSLVYTLPNIIGWLMLHGCPVSPHYYLSVGKQAEALKILEIMAHTNLNKTLLELGVRDVGGVRMASSQRTWQHYFEVFHGLSMLFVINLFIMILSIFLITHGINMWYAELVNRAAFEYHRDPADKYFCTAFKTPLQANNYTHKAACCDSFFGFTDSFILGGVYIISYICLGFLVWVIPRRTVFVIALAMSGVCCIILPTLNKRTTMTVFLVIAIAVPGAAFNLMWSAVMEFVPPHVRGQAVALCDTVGRLGAVIGIEIIDYFLADHCPEIFQVTGFFIIVGAIIAAFTPF